MIRSSWLTLAEEAVRSAGKFLAASHDTVEILANEGRDIKLSLDHESEDRIVSLLRARSDFPILTEERGAVAGRAAGQPMRWIVDPLDGSLNYMKRIPFCCVSVGLWNGDVPILGAVYDFDRDELFSGAIEQGAWLNGVPITVSATGDPADAVLCTGFPVGMDFSPATLLEYVEWVRQYKKVRLFGSAALSLAYVASGRCDSYCERDIRLWDIAAGLAIVRAAGGHVVRTPSRQVDCFTVYAGNRLMSLPSPVSQEV